MTGVKFLFRVTLRRHDLAAEIYQLKEPEKLPLTMSPNEAERLLTMAGSLRDQVMLSLGYGCGLRAGEIVQLDALLAFLPSESTREKDGHDAKGRKYRKPAARTIRSGRAERRADAGAESAPGHARGDADAGGRRSARNRGGRR
jgi:site-specific recombinase XerC